MSPYPKPANRTAYPIEVAAYTATTVISALLDTFCISLYIWRRKRSPVKQRPLVLSLVHRLMMPGIVLLGIGRIHPDLFPCGLFMGCWVAVCICGAMGDIGKALYVYIEYCGGEDLLKAFHNSGSSGGGGAALDAPSGAGHWSVGVTRKSSKQDISVSVSDTKSVMTDDSSFYNNISQTIRIRLFVRTHLVKIVLLSMLGMLAFPNYASSKVSENNCAIGDSGVPVSVLVFLALGTATMHFALKSRMARVQDNFGLREDFNDLAKPTTMLTIFAVISLIPQVYWYAYKNYWFYEQALQVASMIASIVICAKPAMASFSKQYRVLDKSGVGSNRDLTFQGGDNDLFMRFLNEPNKTIFLEQFLVKEMSIENIIFYRAVTGFQKKPTLPLQKKIYHFFIADDAMSQVNLPDKMFRDIEERMNKESTQVDVTIFDEAVEEITSLMFRDAFQRFLSSKEFEASRGTEGNSKGGGGALAVVGGGDENEA